jgi:hypothetical protein
MIKPKRYKKAPKLIGADLVIRFDENTKLNLLSFVKYVR